MSCDGPTIGDPLAGDARCFATPGLFDVQINGYWGRGFKDLDLGPEGMRDLCWSIALSGTTRFLPTITTDDPAVMGAANAAGVECSGRRPGGAPARPGRIEDVAVSMIYFWE